MTFAFLAAAAIAVIFAILAVVPRNPMTNVLSLVVMFFAMAAIFAILGMDFLAAIQVIVYSGAILVLFLFVIMLLNLGHDYRDDLKGGVWAILALVVAGATAGVLARQFQGSEAAPIYDYFRGAEAIDALLAEKGAVGAIAHPLFNEYVVAFELTGILLLVAIVGALALAKRKV